MGVLLPDPTVLALDDEFGFLVLRQFSSALNGVGLTVMERVCTRGAVCLNGPATTGARFHRNLRLSSHDDLSKTQGKAPDWHTTSGDRLAQGKRLDPEDSTSISPSPALALTARSLSREMAYVSRPWLGSRAVSSVRLLPATNSRSPLQRVSRSDYLQPVSFGRRTSADVES